MKGTVVVDAELAKSEIKVTLPPFLCTTKTKSLKVQYKEGKAYIEYELDSEKIHKYTDVIFDGFVKIR